MNKPEYIVIHHSLTKDGTTVDWEAIRKYHVETNGWKDIGYHAGIERIGGVLKSMKGRDDLAIGAHCKEAGMNNRSIGICIVGNFDLTPPDLETLRFLRNMCFAYMVNYGIPAQNVIGHRDAGLMAGYDWRKVGPTGVREFKTCPGELFPMQALQEILAGKIDFSGAFAGGRG